MVLTPLKKAVFLAVSGIAVGLFGILLYVGFPSLHRKIIEKSVRIVDGSMLYEYWRTVPVPIYLEIYFFNITNPIEIYELKEKPRVEEVGPYTYLEKREKVDLKWHENGTVSYREVKQFHFQPELSKGSLDASITQFNVLMLINSYLAIGEIGTGQADFKISYFPFIPQSMVAKAKEMDNFFVYLTINELFNISGSTWLIQKTARKLLFEGYTDMLFNLSSAMATLPADRIGYLYGLNNTDDGIITVHTGVSDINKLNVIDKINGLSYFPGFDPPCNSIDASTGEMFPPYQERQKLTVFAHDLCRKFSFTYFHRSQYEDLESIVYVADKDVLDNGETNPEAKCYCRGNICHPSGVIDLSGCKFGAPVVASYPHFMFADSSYADGVLGLQRPDPKKHQSFIEIQAPTGFPLRAEVKLQLNIIFEGDENILQFQNVTGRTYVPTVWANKRASVTPHMITLIKLALKTTPLIVNVVLYSAVFLSSLFFVFAFICCTLHSAPKKSLYTKYIKKLRRKKREIKEHVWTENQRDLQNSVPLMMKDILKVKTETLENRETVV